MDHKTYLKSLAPHDKARLTQKNDAKGLRHLAVHLGLIILLGIWIAARLPIWGAVMIPQGILIAFLFTLQHEATHKTPFASERLNEAVGWLCGVLIVQPFVWFRYFHLMHHRHTNIPGKDPELDGPPKPETWGLFVWHLSTISYWKDKAVLLVQLGFGAIDAQYLPPRVHGRLRSEARRMVAIYGVAALFTLLVSPVLLWVWLIPLALGFPFLRLYLLAEHGRCPTVANMFENTRTTYTNAVLRFVAWNMPYHTEHHVYPQVPFHQLPQFHAAVRDHLTVTNPGYADFTRRYVEEFKN